MAYHIVLFVKEALWAWKKHQERIKGIYDVDEYEARTRKTLAKPELDEKLQNRLRKPRRTNFDDDNISTVAAINTTANNLNTSTNN